MGEQVEHVQVFKNGGVGALGQMGVQEAALRAERWAWVTVTRKEGAPVDAKQSRAEDRLGGESGECVAQVSCAPT